MKKLIAMLGAVVAAVTSAWAVNVNNPVTWSNTDTTQAGGNLAFGTWEVCLRAQEGMPINSTVALNSIKIANRSGTDLRQAVKFKIVIPNGDDAISAVGIDGTANDMVINAAETPETRTSRTYTFDPAPVLRVGEVYTMKAVNDDGTEAGDSSVGGATGVNTSAKDWAVRWSNQTGWMPVAIVTGTFVAEPTREPADLVFDASTQEWSPITPTDFIVGDTLTYTGTGNADLSSDVKIPLTVGTGVNLTISGNVNISGVSKFESGSTLTIASGTTTISNAQDGKNGNRGLMGDIVIKSGATLSIPKNDSINYGSTNAGSQPTKLDIYGTLACGNNRQSFKAQNTVNLYVGGQITGNGDGSAALDFTNGGNGDTIHVLNDEVVETKVATISSVLRSNSANGKVTLDVAENVELVVTGVVKAGNIIKTGAGTATLSGTNTYTGGTDVNAGTVKTAVAANLNGKTYTISDEGTLEYAVNGDNSTFDSNDLSHITGTGKIRFSGSGYLAIPTDDSNKLWATTLEVVNEKPQALLLKDSTSTYTIGSLSGSGHFRYDWGNNLRTLIIKQSKNTTWSGRTFNAGSSPQARAMKIIVTSENGSVLTYTGDNNVDRTTIIAGEGGTIKSTQSGKLGEVALGINGGTIDLDEGGFTTDGKGYTIVSDGGTIHKTGAHNNNAHSRIIKSLTLNADTAVTGAINGIGTHSDTAATFALDTHTLTVTMDEAWDNANGYGNFYFYNTTISGEGTIKMVKGNLLVHTKATTAADATIEIGENASIQLDGAGSALTVKNLILQKHNNKNFQSGSTITVTGTFTCNDTVPVSKVTLAEGATVTTTVEGKHVEIVNGNYSLVDDTTGPTTIDEIDETNVMDVVPATIQTADPGKLAAWITETSGIETIDGLSAINVNCFLMGVENSADDPELKITAEDLAKILAAESLEAAAAALKETYPNATVTVKDVTTKICGEGATNTHLYQLELSLPTAQE